MMASVFLLNPSHHNHEFNMTSRWLDSKGYFNIGKYKEHRIIWQDYHNACLLKWAHVHHKNGIRTDNRIENLEAMTIRQHSKIHFNPANNKGRHYQWKPNDPRRKFTATHRWNIGNANRGKLKPVRSAEHRQKHNEAMKLMYAERKAKGLRWNGKKWVGDDLP